MWKIILEPCRPQIKIWRMRIACWIPKATNTHSKYVTFTAFSTTTMVERKRLNLIPAYFACAVWFNIRIYLSIQLFIKPEFIFVRYAFTFTLSLNVTTPNTDSMFTRKSTVTRKHRVVHIKASIILNRNVYEIQSRRPSDKWNQYRFASFQNHMLSVATSHYESLSSIPGKSTWGLRWIKWHPNRFLSERFGLPVSLSLSVPHNDMYSPNIDAL
jgi:hypothetical protein